MGYRRRCRYWYGRTFPGNKAPPPGAAEDAMVVVTSALDFDASREALLALIREKLQ